jgi:hypothetical protein
MKINLVNHHTSDPRDICRSLKFATVFAREIKCTHLEASRAIGISVRCWTSDSECHLAAELDAGALLSRLDLRVDLRVDKCRSMEFPERARGKKPTEWRSLASTVRLYNFDIFFLLASASLSN